MCLIEQYLIQTGRIDDGVVSFIRGVVIFKTYRLQDLSFASSSWLASQMVVLIVKDWFADHCEEVIMCATDLSLLQSSSASVSASFLLLLHLPNTTSLASVDQLNHQITAIHIIYIHMYVYIRMNVCQEIMTHRHQGYWYGPISRYGPT
jgi:hypothetical protein